MTLVLTGLVHLTARSVMLAAGAGAVLAAALAAEVWTAGHLLDADPAPGSRRPGCWPSVRWSSGRRTLPDRWWVSDAPVLCRTGLEAGAAAAALPLGAGRGAPRRPSRTTASWTAVLPDRRRRRW